MSSAARGLPGGTAVVEECGGNGTAAAELGGRPTGDRSIASPVHAGSDAAHAAEGNTSEGARQRMIAAPPSVSAIAQEISRRLGPEAVTQVTHDRIPTFWVPKDRVPALLRFLKEDVERPYKMLYDLSAIDERMRA